MKHVNFADFWQIKHIFTQPVAKEGTTFANFWAKQMYIYATNPEKKREFCRFLAI